MGQNQAIPHHSNVTRTPGHPLFEFELGKKGSLLPIPHQKN